MTLEQLAEKHCETKFAGVYEFTPAQLDAYFMERLKMVVGEPVAHYTTQGNWPRVVLDMDGNCDGYETPLHALSVNLEQSHEKLDAH